MRCAVTAAMKTDAKSRGFRARGKFLSSRRRSQKADDSMRSFVLAASSKARPIITITFAAQTSSGIMNAGLASEIPVTMGVLTTDTLEQALERAGCKAGNKGADAMLAAIETANVLTVAENELKPLKCALKSSRSLILWEIDLFQL